MPKLPINAAEPQPSGKKQKRFQRDTAEWLGGFGFFEGFG